MRSQSWRWFLWFAPCRDFRVRTPSSRDRAVRHLNVSAGFAAIPGPFLACAGPFSANLDGAVMEYGPQAATSAIGEAGGGGEGGSHRNGCDSSCKAMKIFQKNLIALACPVPDGAMIAGRRAALSRRPAVALLALHVPMPIRMRCKHYRPQPNWSNLAPADRTTDLSAHPVSGNGPVTAMAAAYLRLPKFLTAQFSQSGGLTFQCR